MIQKIILLSIIFATSMSHGLLTDMSDPAIGWQQLIEVSRSLSKYDEYLSTIFHIKKNSRFRLLETLALKAQGSSFESGELQIQSTLICPNPTLSWESEESLTTIRAISVYFRGCQHKTQREIFKVMWTSRENAVVTVSNSSLSMLMDTGSASDLGRQNFCEIQASGDGVESIECEQMSFKLSAIEEIVIKSSRYSKKSPKLLRAEGYKYRYLKRSAALDLYLDNQPGAVAVLKFSEYKNKELEELNNFQVRKPIVEIAGNNSAAYEVTATQQKDKTLAKKKPVSEENIEESLEYEDSEDDELEIAEDTEDSDYMQDSDLDEEFDDQENNGLPEV